METFIGMNIRECKDVLKKLQASKMAHPFNDPVDPVRFGLTDYFDKIQKPMDLGTVRSNLQRSAYTTGDAFVRDVRLVFENATLYNAPEHDVYIMAVHMQQEFERLIKPFAKKTAAPPPAALVQSEVEIIPELTGRQLSQLLNAVKKTDEAVYYFNEPVDPVKLGIPDYFAKILHPMDLGARGLRGRMRCWRRAGEPRVERSSAQAETLARGRTPVCRAHVRTLPPPACTPRRHGRPALG
jgi:hypothetical protein